MPDKFTKFINENAVLPQETKKPLPIPGGIETLLEIEGQKPLPPIPTSGRRSDLIDLVLINQDTYAQLILYIRNGAYYHTAAEAIGVGSTVLYDWTARGRKDFDSGQDTFYSRFYKDIKKAVAACRVDAEMRLREVDLKRWLSLGPGKMFGNQWTDAPTKSEEALAIEEEFTELPCLPAPKKEETEDVIEIDDITANKAAQEITNSGLDKHIQEERPDNAIPE